MTVNILSPSHQTTAIVIAQDTVDFDRSRGYAATPGYRERAQKIFRGEHPVPFDSPFRVVQGHREDDYIAGTIVCQYFVSCKLATLMEENEIRGATLRSEIVRTQSGEHLCYKRLIITGRCGNLSPLNPDPLAAPTYLCDRLPEPDVDIFVADHGVTPFCSERLAKLIKARKLKVALQRASLVPK